MRCLCLVCVCVLACICVAIVHIISLAKVCRTWGFEASRVKRHLCCSDVGAGRPQGVTGRSFCIQSIPACVKLISVGSTPQPSPPLYPLCCADPLFVPNHSGSTCLRHPPKTWAYDINRTPWLETSCFLAFDRFGRVVRHSDEGSAIGRPRWASAACGSDRLARSCKQPVEAALSCVVAAAMPGSKSPLSFVCLRRLSVLVLLLVFPLTAVPRL